MKTKLAVLFRMLTTITVLALLLSMAPTAPTFAQQSIEEVQSSSGSQPIMIDLTAPLFAYPINTSYCIADVDGANDVASQKDLNRLCMDITTDPTVIEVEWDWDQTGTSGANTMDASIFFDTDGNGFADFGLFVTTQNDPATLLLPIRWATCTDLSATQCTGAVEALTLPAGITCSVASPVAKDPFAAGADYPNDAVGYCYVPRSVFSPNQATTTLLNVCSRSSASLESVRSDCIASEGGGFITVVKRENPPAGLNWTFRLNNGTANVCASPFTITPNAVTGIGSKLCSVQPATYAVTETLTAQNSYIFVYSQCKDSLNNVVGTGAGNPTITGIAITSGDNVTCVFDNTTPTAVDLEYFTATGQKSAVLLEWATGSELNIIGFNVFRDGKQLNSSMLPATNKGQPGGASYSYPDYTARKNKLYTYVLEVVYSDLSTQESDPVTAGLASPGKGGATK